MPSCEGMEALVRREERSLLCRCTIVKFKSQLDDKEAVAYW